jgi:hypothetical protein
MVGSGNILTLAMSRTSLMIHGIFDLVLAPMEWIHSERDEESTQYLAYYYVHKKSSTMVMPQAKVFSIDNPHIWS